jgi:hypothetical protein
MKKVFAIGLLIFSLSCKKNHEAPGPTNPPTVTSISASTAVTGSVTHPQFTITLNIPDTNVVAGFYIYLKAGGIPAAILRPKTGTYTLIDFYNSYPLLPGKTEYISSFLMTDNSSVYNATFTIN